MRTVHRVLALFVVVFTLYLGTTGTLIEAVDIRSMVTNPSPFDPDLMAMREDFTGPPTFRVLRTADYLAQPLPAGADLGRMFAGVIGGARAALGATALKYVELRMQDGQPVGIVQVAGKDGNRELAFAPATGAALGAPASTLDENEPTATLRNTIKRLHRMTTFGDWALWINIVVSLSLAVLLVTGTWVYASMLRARTRLGRGNPFWLAGGWWRALHRVISVVTALFLTLITLSGAWLAVESLWFGLYNAHHQQTLPNGRVIPGSFAIDASAPLRDGAVAGMVATTLAAYHAAMPGVPPRVVRLRSYGGMPQGVVVSGGATARQLVFDARTGRPASLTEPGYPPTGFPFGWQAHQIAKGVHRGSYFGNSGRVMSVLAGLSMIYLSASGIVLYASMWRRRRRAGQPRLIWG